MSENEPVTKHSLFITGTIGFLITCSIFFIHLLSHQQNTLVFCDVGQGDAAYLRINNSIDIVIDAGPNRTVAECIGKHMPFYDNTIELAFISHPQKDHMYGFFFLAERYHIEKVFVSVKDIQVPILNQFKQLLQKKHIPIYELRNGDTIHFTDTKIQILWPTQEFLEAHKKTPAKDLNEYSLIMTVQNRKMKALFTGDAPPRILKRLTEQSDLGSTILKIPHHGSKNGLTRDFLRLANPRVGVISVGKNNNYGHPSQYVLDLLKAQKVLIRRTDSEGSIVFHWN